MADGKRFIAAVDFGTDSVRCFLYDPQGNVHGHAAEHVTKLYPHRGWCEMDPDHVWNAFRTAVRRALREAEATAGDVEAFGLATQRGSFVTWDKRTGDTYHNFVTCSDLRADCLVDDCNDSMRMRLLRSWSRVLRSVTGKSRYASASGFRFTNGMVGPRLRWMLDHNANLRDDADKGFAAVGTLDSYLLHRMTLGQLHATDCSNACVTGIFDPFKLRWNDWLTRALGIAKSMLPEVRDSAGDWGCIHESVFGAEIPIRCVVSDQGASLFGSLGFDKADVHLSMGSGTLLAYNTGDSPVPTGPGLYPTVGWKIGSEAVYLTEAYSSDTSTVIDWCRKMSLFQDYVEISDLVSSAENSDRVFFVPAFGGSDDEGAAGGFIGLLPSTRREHLLRSAVECLAFRTFQMVELLVQQTGTLGKIRVDGKLARNDFLMQLIADLTDLTIERPSSVETAAHGTFYMTGLAAGMWNSRQDIRHFYKIDRTFEPDAARWLNYKSLYMSWIKAVERLSNWY